MGDCTVDFENLCSNPNVIDAPTNYSGFVCVHHIGTLSCYMLGCVGFTNPTRTRQRSVWCCTHQIPLLFRRVSRKGRRGLCSALGGRYLR